MAFGEILTRLQNKHHFKATQITGAQFSGVSVDEKDLEVVFKILKTDQEKVQLESVLGRDTSSELEVSYIFRLDGSSTEYFFFRVILGRKKPSLRSVSELWPAAKIQECELQDLLGIEIFDNQESTFLPQNWQGHPLRKDYVFPEEFNGIEHRRTPLRKEHEKP